MHPPVILISEKMSNRVRVRTQSNCKYIIPSSIYSTSMKLLKLHQKKIQMKRRSNENDNQTPQSKIAKCTAQQHSSVQQLPIHLIHLIAQYNGSKQIIKNMRFVSTQWHNYFSHNEQFFWQQIYSNEFSHLSLSLVTTTADDDDDETVYYNTIVTLLKSRYNYMESIRRIGVYMGFNDAFMNTLTKQYPSSEAKFLFGNSLYLSSKQVSDDSLESIPLGNSKIGGSPDLPLDYSFDNDLEFIVQINLRHASIFTEHCDIFPTDGMLYLFTCMNETDTPINNNKLIVHLTPKQIKESGGLQRRFDYSSKLENPSDRQYSTPLFVTLKYRYVLPIHLDNKFIASSGFSQVKIHHYYTKLMLVVNGITSLPEQFKDTSIIRPSIDPGINIGQNFGFIEDDGNLSECIEYENISIVSIKPKYQSFASEVLEKHNQKHPENQCHRIYKRVSHPYNRNKKYMSIHQINGRLFYHDDTTFLLDTGNEDSLDIFEEYSSEDTFQENVNHLMILLPQNIIDKCEEIQLQLRSGDNTQRRLVWDAYDKIFIRKRDPELDKMCTLLLEAQQEISIRRKFLLDKQFDKAVCACIQV
jgi:hypothetical protein